MIQISTFLVANVLLSCLAMVANGWCLPPTNRAGIPTKSRETFVALSMSATTEEEVTKMRLSEIKSELKERKIDFSDCFDKESMVAKLTDARANNIDNSVDETDDDKEEVDGNETTRNSSCSGSSCSRSSSSDSTSTDRTESASPETFDRDKALEELQGMRVRELREELGRRRISRAGLFEKDDLVNALLEARAIASVFSGTGLLTPGEVADLSEKDVQTEMDHPGSLLLLDVYATWCGPCQMIAPILKEIAAEEGDELRVIKMDSDKNQQLAGKLKVAGLPTLVLFQGGNEIDRLEGAPTKDQLKGWIDSRR